MILTQFFRVQLVGAVPDSYLAEGFAEAPFRHPFEFAGRAGLDWPSEIKAPKMIVWPRDACNQD